MSYWRFAIYVLFRLGRTAVAVSMLYAGTQWLARTTNITDLILNAVALEAVLQIDEMIFTSLFPKKLQAAIYELEPVKVRYNRRWGQIESCLVLCTFVTVVLAPFFLWVHALAGDMLAVKAEYCAGNKDFVVSLNQEMSFFMIIGAFFLKSHRCGQRFYFKDSKCVHFFFDLLFAFSGSVPVQFFASVSCGLLSTPSQSVSFACKTLDEVMHVVSISWWRLEKGSWCAAPIIARTMERHHRIDEHDKACLRSDASTALSTPSPRFTCFAWYASFVS